MKGIFGEHRHMGLLIPLFCTRTLEVSGGSPMTGKRDGVFVPVISEQPLPAAIVAHDERASTSSSPFLTQSAALARSGMFASSNFLLFVLLQTLDILSTTLGLRLGAQEGNLLLARIIRLGILPGLLLVKFIVIVAIIAIGRERLMRRLNFWFAGLVSWNMATILFWVSLNWFRNQIP